MGRVQLVKKTGSIFVCLAIGLMLFTLPVHAEGSLRIERIASEFNGPQLKYHIAYPRISGMKNEEMQHKLNVAFMEKAESARTLMEYEAKSAGVIGSVDYGIRRNQDGILSLVIKESMDTTGHGVSLNQTGVTVDTVTGQRYLIGDLFAENADYVTTLSEQVKAQISRAKLDAGMVKPFQKINENADYYLTGDMLVLYFKQGEYFTSACGVKEFAIPLATLNGILRTQFIIRT